MNQEFTVKQEPTMNQGQVFDGSQTCFPVPQCPDFLQGHHFNGMQTLSATQIPQHPSQGFSHLLPVAGQDYCEPSQQSVFFLPDWLKQPGHDILMERIDITNGQNGVWMSEVKRELLKTEPPFYQNWTTGGFRNGQYATWMPEVKQESVNTEPPFNQNWTTGDITNGQNGVWMSEVKRELLKTEPLFYQNWTTGGSTDNFLNRKPPSTSRFPHGGAGEGTHSFVKPPEQASQKRQLYRIKNRQAAKDYREKKKEYIEYLKNRVDILEKQNRNLTEELTFLKDTFPINME